MAKPWYQYPRVDNFGQKDPQGNYWKPDSNVQCPPGCPITALLPGVVSSVQRTGYGQTVVTIKLNSPINRLATHTFYEHMHDASVGKGQKVNAGDLIGHNNLSGEGAPLGFGLYSGDVYGSGTAWTVLQQDLAPGGAGLLNPTQLLDAAANGSLQTGGGSGGNGFFSAAVQTAANSVNPANLAPTVEVTTLLWALDQALVIENPFTANMDAVPKISIVGWSTGIDDPFAWIAQFGTNVIDDLSALTVRWIFLAMGFFVLYKVASAFIDFGAIANATVNVVKTAMVVAA